MRRQGLDDLLMKIAKKVKNKFIYKYRVSEAEADEVYILLLELKPHFDNIEAYNFYNYVFTKLWNGLKKRLLVRKTKKIDGKLKRFYISPHHNEVALDGNHEMIYDSNINQKVIFYDHINSFKLTKQELEFIELVFGGYHPEHDIEVFEELDLGMSVNHFFITLIKKLKLVSPFNLEGKC